MCGICGVIEFGQRPLKTSQLQAMTSTLAHRGPDDAGYLVANYKNSEDTVVEFTDQRFRHLSQLENIEESSAKKKLHEKPWNLFLGHRRLSIIDISHDGHQPLANQSKEIWITYNGELYNYLALKSELLKCGYSFSTATDTEVILYAYQEWGIDVVKRFNGMFAFALWDKRNNLFFLVRDRYGIKPLYYTLNAAGLVFASETKAIIRYMADTTRQPALDHEALVEYFTFQNIFTDKTLHQNIHLLAPGHIWILNLNNPHLQPRRHQYWDFHFAEPANTLDQRPYIEELHRLFKQAVERQLIGDVEIGSYLSGGMDSGSITAIAAKSLPYLKTFTVGFDLHSASGLELAFDEREKAEHMSYLFKTEHYEMVLKSGDMERCLPHFAWHLEEPRVGQSYPNFYASKLASKFVKVVLAGVGGDELFGGYPWRYYRALVNDNFEHYIDQYYQFWQRLVDHEQLQQMFSPIWQNIARLNTRDIFRNVFKNHANTLTTPEDYVNHSLYFEAKTFLHGLLVVEDKLSMAHSLETRIPYLDNDLVDFAIQLPVNVKLGNLKQMIAMNENEPGDKVGKYFAQTNDGKLILRQALQRYIPKPIIEGVKKGFSSPDGSWFKGDSMEYVRKKILQPDATIYNFINYRTVASIVNQHMQGKENKRLLIWSLLNFAEWCNHYYEPRNHVQ